MYNDKRAQILYEKRRWQQQRSNVFNEDDEIGDPSEDDTDVVQGMPKATEPGSLDKHRHRRDAPSETDPTFKGDLQRFEHNGFVYRILHTTIDRDDLRFHRGWEIYNDQGRIVDWFYDTDAGGEDPKQHAEHLLKKKFKSFGPNNDSDDGE